MSKDRKDGNNPALGVQDENRLIGERREKLHALKAAGNAFPNDFRPNALAGGLADRFQDLDAEALAAVDERIAVTGRMMAKRVMGKIACVSLQDRSGTIQLVVQRDNLPEGVYQQFKQWDIGDIIGGEGGHVPHAERRAFRQAKSHPPTTRRLR